MKEIEKIRSSVESKKIPYIYLWYSEDRFLWQDSLQILLKYYRNIDPSGSNIERISARQVLLTEIVARANTCSFFPNLMIVDDVNYFQEGQGANDYETLFTYFSKPNPNTCLLFLTENIHKGRKLYKEFTKVGDVIEFALPKRPSEWQSWLQDELHTRDKSMKAGTSAFFLEWAGHQVGVLSQELDKLSLYVAERKEITVQDIKAVSTRTVEANVFDLLNAVAKKSATQAVQSLHAVLGQEHPLKILSLLTRQVRLLLGAQAARNQGIRQENLPGALGISPYEAQKIWQQSLQFSWAGLVESLGQCLKTERAIKTGKGEGALLLELMVVKFCG